MEKKHNILFFGTPQFAATILEDLLQEHGLKVGCVVTQPDRPAGRKQKMQISAVKGVAEGHHLPTLQPAKIRGQEDEFINELNQHGPFDLAVVVAFGQILPERVLILPKKGCINVHASLLPRWRGAAPIQRAIMADDKETGISLMKMEKGLDSGPVYLQKRVEILQKDNFETLSKKLVVIASELLLQFIYKIIADELAAVPQPADGVTYAKKITPPDSRIKWTLSASQLAALVRALYPQPTAFTLWQGKRLKILSAVTESQATIPRQNPGTIASLFKEKLAIQCGKDLLSLQEVQLEGRKNMSVKQFINGHRLSVGELLT